MAVRKGVFASKAERDNFYKLRRTWSGKYGLYHNVPFLNVFDLDTVFDMSTWPLRLLQLDGKEVARLKKTSIDYVLCDKDDVPLLCIEFDGLQEGVNVGDEYYSRRRHDPFRQEVFELKLRVAHGSFFPFFIVGSDVFRELGGTLGITIVDGIIGEVLAKNSAADKVQAFSPELYGLTQEEFDGLSPEGQAFYVDDFVLSSEVEAEAENSPVFQLRWKLQKELAKRGVAVRGHESRAEWRKGHEFRLRAKVEHPDTGIVTADASLTDHQGPGFVGFNLVENLAVLFALLKVKYRLDGNYGSGLP